MDERYEIVAVTKACDLDCHRKAILNLFRDCFGKPMDPALWSWVYERNPCGDPFVQMAYCRGDLVGHYAVIPADYRHGDVRYRVALSLTTMVRADHRKAGLFVALADATYRDASDSGVSMVVGFPNSNSTPGFKKRLGWTILEEYSLQSIASPPPGARDDLLVESIDVAEFCARFTGRNGAMLDLSAPALLNWRLSKPGCDYRLLAVGGHLAIVKGFGTELDAVFTSSRDADVVGSLVRYSNKAGYQSLNLFMPTVEQNAASLYRFGFRELSPGALLIDPQLIMSDVF